MIPTSDVFFKHTEQQVSAILNPFKDGDTVPIKMTLKFLGEIRKPREEGFSDSKGDRNPTAIPVGSEI